MEKSSLHDFTSAYDKNGVDSFIDQKKLLSNFKDMEDLLCKTIESFLATLPEMLINIELSIQEKNPEKIEFSAHKLKGSLSNFFPVRAGLLAASLEKFGKQHHLQEAEQCWESLKKEMVGVQKELETLYCTAK